MFTSGNELREITLEEAPGKLSNISVGYNEENFLLVLDYVKELDEPVNRKVATIFSPESMQIIIKALFEVAKEYQKEFGKDIGFGAVEGE